LKMMLRRFVTRTKSWRRIEQPSSRHIFSSLKRIFKPKAVSKIGSLTEHSQPRPVSQKITYTITDEAPALATFAFLPTVRRFARWAGIGVDTSDISLAGRILASFPERLEQEHRVSDELSILGDLCKKPDANIIKLPNISASIPQLNAAIKELREKGYDIPKYPAEPKTEEEEEIKARYAKVLGSAVNPVLREGNSDRRVATPVKEYAQNFPHKLGKWKPDCKSHVAFMKEGDYYDTEQSHIMPEEGTVSIEFVNSDGVKKLKDVKVLAGEVIDAAVMRKKSLCEFYEDQMKHALEQDIMISLHLKATMMKISDPIFFGHCVDVYYKDALEKHADTLADLKVNTRNGIGDVYQKIKKLPKEKRGEIEKDLDACYNTRPKLSYVNSIKGITNLHVPSDIIIDASMPNVVRDSGKMWNKDNELEDTKCLIPDRSYSRIYDAVLDDCRSNGQFNVKTMGAVSNVGLMAQKAEEYGSHDKTFEMEADGTVRVTDDKGQVLFEHNVSEGDVWRMCQVKDEPIRDWVNLAVKRARATNYTTIFWLDNNRAHDSNLITLVQKYLSKHDTTGLDIRIMDPVSAVKKSCEMVRAGESTVSCTGNVLRDYLTDLFPIIELGTSAKMLSIVPLMAGGGLYETGAGGSAPKHVQQFVDEGHLRWDSLGEYLAVAVSLEDLGMKGCERATILSETLMEAIGKFLNHRRSPSRNVHEEDNRSSTYFITLYWAEAMASRVESFGGLAKGLRESKSVITKQLIRIQGDPVDIGGYYKVDTVKASAAMRPSTLFNKILRKETKHFDNAD